MEPSLFIISIIPYIFDVTLNLFINEEGSKADDNNKLNKIIINQEESKMDINILYSSYSYHIIEDNLDINIKIDFDICNVFNNTIGREDKINEYKKEYINYSNKENCKKCFNNEFLIIKSLSNYFPICSNCFKATIDNVLIKRYQNMVKEKFSYIEYYLKEIPLLYIENSNDYIYLSQIEFFYIFNQNLFTYFRNLIKNVCDQCGLKTGKIIHKICGCKRCIKCAKKECTIIFFSNFEKNFVFKNETMICKCGKNIDKLKYASQIFSLLNNEDKNFHEKEAKNRNKKYIENYCMNCGKELEKNIISIKKKIYFSYNLTSDDLEKSEKNIKHNLCEDCNEKNINDKNNKIFCKICDEEHKFSKDNINNSLKAPNPIKDSGKFSNNNNESIKEGENFLKKNIEKKEEKKEEKEEEEEKKEKKDENPNSNQNLKEINDNSNPKPKPKDKDKDKISCFCI